MLRHEARSDVLANLPIEEERRKRPFLIPTRPQTPGEFIQDVRQELLSAKTHIYIDTSFLVWLTMLGKDARQEFIKWMDSVGRARFHIPAWAAHEFLRHHVQDLVGDGLAKIANKLSNTADETYSYLRPFLDAPVKGDPRNPEQIRTETREILVEVKRLAAWVSRWRGQHYPDHFNEVAMLVNDIGLPDVAIFNFMTDIDVLQKSRFSGRVPPGFKDRAKKDKYEKNGDEETLVGSNRFGDLMFWREVLFHARAESVDTIVILTNDRKNDWHMGAQDTFAPDDELLASRKNWPPVPVAHPMLCCEASAIAGVSRVVLVDSPYLAAFLRKT